MRNLFGLVDRFVAQSGSTKGDERSTTLRSCRDAGSAFSRNSDYERFGDLTRVGRVLAKLSEAIQPETLASLAQREKRLPLVQRLGYLLETIGRREHAEPLAQLVAHSRPRHTSLDPSASIAGLQPDPRWRLYPNEQVEVEE